MADLDVTREGHPYTDGERLLRLETLIGEHVRACTHREDAYAALSRRIDGRPSWSVCTFLAALTTVCGVLATIIAAGVSR
jgi:hypothetical protein